MPGYEESLGDGLVLRTVRDGRDREKYLEFYSRTVGGRDALTVDSLLHHHPQTSLDDFVMVEDQRRGEVVSTTELIPWRCRFQGIELDVAMLETVATHPDYRHHGLIRAQIRRFHQVVDERQFDLCVVEGIPYYYRQFGYAYAIDTRPSCALAAQRIPDGPAGEASPFGLRQATADDLPALVRLYEEAMAPLQFHVTRDAEFWRFVLDWVKLPVRLVEDRRDGGIVGYIAMVGRPGGRGVGVPESAVRTWEASMAILRRLKEEGVGDISLGGPPTDSLVQLARSLGAAKVTAAYHCLWRIPDVVRFLTRIAPALERRVAASDCAGLSTALVINLYRYAIGLRFEAGRLVEVAPAGFVDASMGADGGDLCIPPDAFVRLVLGYRDLDELRDAWPDIVIRPASRHLLDLLFPKMAAHLYWQYVYSGPVP